MRPFSGATVARRGYRGGQAARRDEEGQNAHSQAPWSADRVDRGRGIARGRCGDGTREQRLDVAVPSSRRASSRRRRTRRELFVHTHTNYTHPGDKAHGGFAKTVTVFSTTTSSSTRWGPAVRGDVHERNDAEAGLAACGPNAGASKNASVRHGQRGPRPLRRRTSRAASWPSTQEDLERQPDDRAVHQGDPGGQRDGQLRQPGQQHLG